MISLHDIKTQSKFYLNTSKKVVEAGEYVEITNSIPNTAITTISQDGLNKIADDISNRE